MRNAKRTFFNKLYQPHRIGRAIKKPKKQIKTIIGSTLFLYRRQNRSKRNQIFARYTSMKLRVQYGHYQISRSFMVKRCSGT